MSHRDGVAFPADTATQAIEEPFGLALLNERPQSFIDHVDFSPHARVLHRLFEECLVQVYERSRHDIDRVMQRYRRQGRLDARSKTVQTIDGTKWSTSQMLSWD